MNVQMKPIPARTPELLHPLSGQRVYLAGPMTGYKDFNYPLFHRTAKELRALGVTVLNPAETNLPLDSLHQDFMREGISKLLQCSHIIMLPHWSLSEGADLECQVAVACGMEVWAVIIDPSPTVSPVARPLLFKRMWEGEL